MFTQDYTVNNDYREDHKVVRLFANKKNFFNNRWNLKRCPGETSYTYLTIDQKFIGVVSTETEICFFENKCPKFQISNFKIKKKLNLNLN
jgi:hypothetical protein